jgi:hypothetical protein
MLQSKSTSPGCVRRSAAMPRPPGLRRNQARRPTCSTPRRRSSSTARRWGWLTSTGFGRGSSSSTTACSLALTRPFAGDWAQLIALSQKYIENEQLEQQAEEICRAIARRFASTMTAGRSNSLSEDYIVFSVNEFDTATSADDLLARRSEEIALMVRGERQALSRQEREEVLKNRLSYLANDLVIPTWNAAFVYDTEAGAQAALEIIEFANSQLLEYRISRRPAGQRAGPDLRAAAAAAPLVGINARPRLHQDHSTAARLFIDVNEITDRTENALKMVGDIYSARLISSPHGLGSRPGRRTSKTSSRRSTTSITSPSSSWDLARSPARADHHPDSDIRGGAVVLVIATERRGSSRQSSIRSAVTVHWGTRRTLVFAFPRS